MSTTYPNLFSWQYFAKASTLLVCILALYNCGQKSAAAVSLPPPLPNTPDSVVQAWQFYIDKNQFAEARRLSSAAVLPEVDLIEQQMQYEIADSTIINTNFVNITCQEIVDTAWCDCLIEFEGEEYPDRYRLLRVNGQWLMDRRPENPDEMQSDSLLLDLFKEMLESE